MDAYTVSKPTTDPFDQLMSVAEASRVLRKTTRQVQNYLNQGLLSGRKIGRNWMIYRASIEAFKNNPPPGIK